MSTNRHEYLSMGSQSSLNMFILPLKHYDRNLTSAITPRYTYLEEQNFNLIVCDLFSLSQYHVGIMP